MPLFFIAYFFWGSYAQDVTQFLLCFLQEMWSIWGGEHVVG